MEFGFQRDQERLAAVHVADAKPHSETNNRSSDAIALRTNKQPDSGSNVVTDTFTDAGNRWTDASPNIVTYGLSDLGADGGCSL
jgi:hypothetical protein